MQNMEDSVPATYRSGGAARKAVRPAFESSLDLLKNIASNKSNNIAFIDQDRALTYRELHQCVAGFSQELIGHSIKQKPVALICDNSLEFVVAYYAIQAASAQVMPINPEFTGPELLALLADAEPVAVVYQRQEHIETALRQSSVPAQIAVGQEDLALDSWRHSEGLQLPEPMPEADLVSNLQYTGGTTGRPKGVRLSHSQIMVNLEQRDQLLPMQPNVEKILCFMPMFHIFAIHMCLLCALSCGGTLVIHRRYHPEKVLRSIECDQITFLPASPTAFIGLMRHDHFPTTDFSLLSLCASGSAPLSAEISERWEKITGSPICEGYGQTEAGPILTHNPKEGLRKSGSVGLPLPGTEIQIVDSEHRDRILPQGEAGEIRARGPQIMSGYLNRPEETEEALHQGWLYTGDIGFFDEDGYLHICDRKKDMVVIGGYNVYPREVDEVLVKHPDIEEAISVGILDEYRGEILRSYIVTTPDTRLEIEEVLEFCKSQLVRYKIPQEIIFMDSLPKTAIGKIDKASLRVGEL